MRVLRHDPRAWDDVDLLAAIADGDGSAFSVFYRRHLSSVLAYLVGQTRDPETAADLAAEVFAAVLLAARRYRAERDTALPWLLGIARRKLLESYRRGRVESEARRRMGLEPVLFDDVDLRRVERLASAGQSHVEQLFASLPDHERDVIAAHVLQEQGYREIASRLDCSEMVVRKRVSRGLARLRTRLENGSDTGEVPAL
jgi:RNA polymerase sigma factor (sigma-70 family)